MRYAINIDMIWYRVSCEARVFETEKSVFLVRCIRYVHRESKESTSEVVDFVYKCIMCYTFKCTTRMAITFVSAFIDSYTILPNKIQLYLIVCTEKKIPV